MEINSVSVEAFEDVVDDGRILFSYETEEGWSQIMFKEKNGKWTVNSKNKELVMSIFDKFLTDIGL